MPAGSAWLIPLLRCTCDPALQEWQYRDPGGHGRHVWAGSLADVVHYQVRKPTPHDILDGRRRRLQRGQCGERGPTAREE